MFSYSIMKAFRNIPINIMGREGKRLCERFGVYIDVRVLRIMSFCEVFSRYFGHHKVL